MRTPLAKDTKAVLRELRRHHRAIELSLETIASTIVELEFAVATLIGEENIRRAGILRASHPVFRDGHELEQEGSP